MSLIEIEGQYYIQASSSFADNRKIILKQGESFGIFDLYGDIYKAGEGYYGIYHHGTRFISQMEFSVENKRPLLLSSNLREENEVLTIDLANSDFFSKQHNTFIEHGTIHILRKKFIYQGVYYEEILFHNYDTRGLQLKASFKFNGDFADIFEIRGMKRERKGYNLGIFASEREMAINYIGLDEVKRTATLTFDPAPDHISENRADFIIDIGPKATHCLHVKAGLTLNNEASHYKSFEMAHNELLFGIKKLKKQSCSFFSDNEQFNDWVNRSKSDLYTLLTETEHGYYPYAGIPWYSTAFGRDGIITALMCLWMDPEITKGVLHFLAQTQATMENDFMDAEPGKIFHEVRSGEMAATREIPFQLYYGTIDATMLFVVLAGEYLKRTNDRATIKKIWSNIVAAINWIDRYGDIDKDGFIEYKKKSEKGLDNQGWKDSFDSVFYENGKLAKNPIALCEVQAYAYHAKVKASEMANHLGKADLAEKWHVEAEQLKQKFNKVFWVEEKSTFAIALDGDKTPCKVSSSNAGQCLFSGIVDDDKAGDLIKNLLSESMFSGWGIRTIGKNEVKYNPMSYHNGSIWPHDNALIALGMKRYGFEEGVKKIFTSLMDTSLYVEDKRLPELFCGFERRENEGPTAYPVACSPQAWAVASVFLMISTVLGIEVDSKNNRVTFHKPSLPDFMTELTVYNLMVNGNKVTFKAEKINNSVSIRIIEKTGNVDVVVRI
jgi:glycogen debranching enzyme